MDKISSTTNNIVKNAVSLAQRKYRDEKGLFLAEGQKAIKGLYDNGFEIKELFIKQEKVNIKCENTYLVNDAILSKISTTKTACNEIGVFKQRNYKKEDILKKDRILLLENIKDGGNLGTILRSAKAFDIEAIMLLGDTIDLYNPKVVRASVGCFDIPVINIDYSDLKDFEKFKIYTTALYEKSCTLEDVKVEKPFVIAFGSEADGLSENFLKGIKISYENLNIETSGKVESLNLAAAVSICLYKFYVAQFRTDEVR